MDAITPDGDLLHRLIAAAELRARVTGANLANVDTPGYRRQVVRFEDSLADALRRGGDAQRGVRAEVLEDTVSPARPDGNNVSLELELNTQRENELLMDAYMTILQARFTLLQTAITESR